ncbi:unannotated protein [freshwater metagenome]|uniref:Unannotated protein n=1 Tax=freshwater metagenome TaxID=449393 RepID=A0A6J7E1V8_9ZZZZ
MRTIARTEPVYQVDLRFGRGALKRIGRDVARLSIFPSARRPAVVLLGVRTGGRGAVFLVEEGVKVSGEGHCHPDAARCRTFELRTGATEMIQVTGRDGVVRTYQLDLLGIPKVMMTKSDAAEAYARASAAGSKLLTKDGRPGARRTQLYGWRWDPDTALLTPIAQAASGAPQTGPGRSAPLVEPKIRAAQVPGSVRGG